MGQPERQHEPSHGLENAHKLVEGVFGTVTAWQVLGRCWHQKEREQRGNLCDDGSDAATACLIVGSRWVA